MDIVERLNLFLEQAGISKSQFADSCNIPRPTVSQILGGRNKRISDEIIAKIHSIYPNLSVMWLMFGEGEMLLNGNDGQIASTTGLKTVSLNARIFDDTPSVPKEHQQTDFADNKSDLSTSMHFQSAHQHQPHKTITKIVVFYSDNSFEEFHKHL